MTYWYLPVSQLINVSDINMIMSSVAAALVYYNRKELIYELQIIQSSLKRKTKLDIHGQIFSSKKEIVIFFKSKKNT